MKHEYNYMFYNSIDIGFVKVDGAEFCHQDLYELVGKNEYMTTFNLRQESESYIAYGQSITGVVFYTSKERDNLENDPINLEFNRKVKILEYGLNRSNIEKEELKYGGIPLSHIDFITFTPFTHKTEKYESGEKIVPNIIEIPLEHPELYDADCIYQNYIADKINSGTRLLPFETEKFIGITLALNKGTIDSRLIGHLGYSVSQLQENHNVYYHWYKVLERRGKLPEHLQQPYKDIKLSRFVTRLERMMDEFKRGGINTQRIQQTPEFWKKLMDLKIKFEPSILLHGTNQVWWDFDSYIHILLRHVKDWQVSNFKKKTSFPYKFKDLQRLIEKVLREIEHEIESHFEKTPGKEFKRVGKMSVLFNQDYYHVQIDGSGRLINLYVSNSL